MQQKELTNYKRLKLLLVEYGFWMIMFYSLSSYVHRRRSLHFSGQLLERKMKTPYNHLMGSSLSSSLPLPLYSY